MKRLSLWAVTALACLAIVGCGGSAGSASIGRSATFTVTWPEPSRLVPSLSKSMKVVITNTKGFSKTTIIARPATGNVSRTKIEDLPVGTVLNTLSALPNADGTGTAQATGSVTTEIKVDELTKVDVTLVSTITKVLITPSVGATIRVGAPFTFKASARNASDQVVLAPLEFYTVDPTIATVDKKSGVLTGIAEGETEIFAKDPESKVVSISAPITVKANVFRPDTYVYGVQDPSSIFNFYIYAFYVFDAVPNTALYTIDEKVDPEAPHVASLSKSQFDFGAPVVDQTQLLKNFATYPGVPGGFYNLGGGKIGYLSAHAVTSPPGDGTIIQLKTLLDNAEAKVTVTPQ